MFGPELKCSMYKCCFLACFCASQRVQRWKAKLTLAQIREKLRNGWADWHKFGTHVQFHMGMDIRQTNCPLKHKEGTWGVLGGHQFKSLGKLSDWHQIWFTSEDSSGNGHRLNPSCPSVPQGALGEGGRGSHIQKSGEAVKRQHRLAPNLVHVGGFVWEWT